MSALLTVERLVKKFGKTQVLHGVSFSVEKGETFGLVGESGCGKTTVGRTVLGIYPADGGSAHFHGQEILGLQGKERKAFAKKAQKHPLPLYRKQAVLTTPKLRGKCVRILLFHQFQKFFFCL